MSENLAKALELMKQADELIQAEQVTEAVRMETQPYAVYLSKARRELTEAGRSLKYFEDARWYFTKKQVHE